MFKNFIDLLQKHKFFSDWVLFHNIFYFKVNSLMKAPTKRHPGENKAVIMEGLKYSTFTFFP